MLVNVSNLKTVDCQLRLDSPESSTAQKEGGNTKANPSSEMCNNEGTGRNADKRWSGLADLVKHKTWKSKDMNKKHGLKYDMNYETLNMKLLKP